MIKEPNQTEEHPLYSTYCELSQCTGSDAILDFDLFSLENFDKNGFFITKNFLSEEIVKNLSKKVSSSFGIQSHSYIHECDNRIHCPIDLDSVIDDAILKVVSPHYSIIDTFLKRTKELVELSSITVFPNAEEQILHRDDSDDHRYYMSIFINLTPTQKNSGCLWVIPGSHKDLDIDFRKEHAIPVCLPAGSVVYMNSKLMHFGGANTTDDRFRSVFYCSFGDGDIKGQTYSIADNVREKRLEISDFHRADSEVFTLPSCNYTHDQVNKIDMSKKIIDENISMDFDMKNQYLDLRRCVFTTANDSEMHCLFPTTIFRKNLDERKYFDRLIDKVIHRHTSDDSVKYKNGISTASEKNGEVFVHHEKKLEPLFSQIKLNLIEYFEARNLKTELFEFYVNKCWVTSLTSNECQSNNIMSHQSHYSDVSFAYYHNPCNTSNPLAIEFYGNKESSCSSLFYEDECGSEGSVDEKISWFNSPYYHLYLSTGDLLIFPNDLAHRVVDDMNDQKRFVIEGNVSLVLKPECMGMPYGSPHISHWRNIS